MEASFASGGEPYYFHHPQFALVESAASSSSIHERRWANTVKRELEVQQTILAGEQDDLVWYFLTFCCGYGFGYKSHNGKFTWVNNRRLTPQLVAQQLGLTDKERPYKNLSIATPNQTMAVCIDVDINSKYHPANDGNGIEPVKDALAEIGLTEALEFQSSYSNGMHLWYPLSTAQKSWKLAKVIEDACRIKNLEIKDGVLELRPNRRRFNSNFKLIRAPLSGEGNALWVGELGGLEDFSIAILRHFFCLAKDFNLLTPLMHNSVTIVCSSSYTRALNHKAKNLSYYKNVLSDGFTNSSQTQKISLSAMIVARMVEGIDSVGALRVRLIELLTSVPGYQQFCKHQRQIESGRYWSDLTLQNTLHFSPSDYENSWRKAHNDKRALQATEKAQQAIFSAVDDGLTFSSKSAAIEALRARYDAPSRRWWWKKRNDKYKKNARSDH